VTAESNALPGRDRATLDQIAAARDEDTIQRALDAARQRLEMDAAYVSVVDSTRQLITELAGDGNAVGLGPGTEVPIEKTYCARMLNGELPNVVPDTAAEPAVRDLEPTKRIGAYVGMPVRLADGRLHGTLCCASTRPRHELGDAELAFMRVLAEMVAARIDRAHGSQGA
jgi:GAF domain-containing protein